MVSSSTQGGSFRRSLSVRLSRFHRKLHQHSDNASSTSPQRSNANPSTVQNAPSQPPDQAVDAPIDPAATGHDNTHMPLDSTAPDPNNPGQNPTNQSTPGIDSSSVIASSDLWSAAYREAVDRLSEDVDVVILMGSSVAQLFRELEDMDKEATHESLFLRGVAYLRSIQVPLERFKLALDLASPLGALDPVATGVLGVVRGISMIAISLATADLEFARLIGEMLEQISYIDDCDTLGQRTNKADIHKALVSVYEKILEFYIAAHDILTMRGRKLAMQMILETDRLPNIVQEFLRRAETLRKLIEKATWEVAEDIKTMLYDREISRWLDSGKINQQSRYHTRLQDLKSDEACEFLLTDPKFSNWYLSPDSQRLVILGEMGSGKTIAMAFLVDDLSQRNEHQIPRPKICYYYCRDDETGQAVYILSAIVLALLEQLPGLKKTFYEWYKENQASGILDPATSTNKLGEFLGKVLETLDRSLFFIIDGLDECDRASRKTLLELLTTLSRKTPRLKIVLSSRPEEEILEQLDGVPSIDMSSEAHRDTLIVRHTVEGQLSYLSADVKALVIETLSRLAQGSAIWTKMIVELIEVRKIRAVGPMRTLLKEVPLPGQLSNLYVALLSRSSSKDPENQELGITALQILAVAARPLSILELAWGVALAAAKHEVTTVADLAQLVDHQRVMSLIHPFIARIDYRDVRKRQVQLVHQSVREFVVREWPRLQTSPSSETHHQTDGLEAFMLDNCIKYLLLDEIGNTPLFSDGQIALDELPHEPDLFNDTGSFEYDHYCTWEVWEETMVHYDPSERGFGEFFVYASSHWFKHFGAIKTGPLPSLAKIEKLCQIGSMRFDNWTSQNCRPGCALKARFEFDSRLYDALSITSLYGSEAILRNLLENSNFEEDKYLPDSGLQAADQILQWGNLSRLKILFLEKKLGRQLRSLEFFRLIIRRWFDFRARHDNWDAAFDLIEYMVETLVEERWGNELLCVAARAGCTPMIRRLSDRAQNNAELRTELLRDLSVLGEHASVVRRLLGKETSELHLQ